MNISNFFIALLLTACCNTAIAQWMVRQDINPLFTNGPSTDINTFFVDLDDDYDLDIVVGADNSLFYYENNGLDEWTQVGNVLPVITTDDLTPVLFDMDDDDDFDLIVGDGNCGWLYYENTGTESSPTFTLQSGPGTLMDPVGCNSLIDDVSPWFVDIDDDDDLDFFGGGRGGFFIYYENTGDKTSPNLVSRVGALNPMDGFDVGIESAPYFVDFDVDGDADLLSGDGDGQIHYYENIGTAIVPVFVERTGVDNAFDAVDVGDDTHIFLARTCTGVGVGGFFGSASNTLEYWVNDTLQIDSIETVCLARNTVLPVEVLHFQASANQNCSVNISWEVSTEINVTAYTVYRSSDGENWSEVCTFNGNGSNASYSCIDAAIQPGISYYKLSKWEDGVETDLKYSSTQIGYCDGPFEFNYNMSNSVLYVFSPDMTSNLSLQIFDMSGKIVFWNELNSNSGFDLSGLREGFYIANVNYDDGRREFTKFIR